MRRFILTVLALAAVATPAFGQMSPQAAMEKLKAKQAARDTARAKPLTITQGEYDDMKAEIARLQAQLAALQAKATALPATAPAMPVHALAVGLTHAEVLRFVQIHRDTYEIKTDEPAPNAAGKGIMVLVEKGKKRVYDGTFGFNGQSHLANYREQLRPVMQYDLVLTGDKVTNLANHKITESAPDETMPQWRGR